MLDLNEHIKHIFFVLLSNGIKDGKCDKPAVTKRGRLLESLLTDNFAPVCWMPACATYVLRRGGFFAVFFLASFKATGLLGGGMAAC